MAYGAGASTSCSPRPDENQSREENGFMARTPVGSKCRTFPVATVRPCSRAVAAIRRDTPVADGIGKTSPTPRHGQFCGQDPIAVEGQNAVQPGCKRACLRRIAALLPGDTPLNLAYGNHAEVEIRRPLTDYPLDEVGAAFRFAQRRDNIRVDQVHQRSIERGSNGSLSNSPSSCGIASGSSARLGACARSRCRRRSYSSTETTTTAGLPRRVTR